MQVVTGLALAYPEVGLPSRALRLYSLLMQLIRPDRLGAFVRVCREEAGLSQRELAKVVSCSHGAISDIESGRRLPSLQLAAQLAEALNVTIDQLARGAR